MRLLLLLILAAQASENELTPSDRSKLIDKLRSASAPLENDELESFCKRSQTSVKKVFERLMPMIKRGDAVGAEGLERMRASYTAVRRICEIELPPEQAREQSLMLRKNLLETASFLDALVLRDELPPVTLGQPLDNHSTTMKKLPELRAASPDTLFDKRNPAPGTSPAVMPRVSVESLLQARREAKIHETVSRVRETFPYVGEEELGNRTAAVTRFMRDLSANSSAEQSLTFRNDGSFWIKDKAGSGGAEYYGRYEPIRSGVGDSWLGPNQKQMGLSVYADKMKPDGSRNQPKFLIQYLDGSRFEVSEDLLRGEPPGWIRLSTTTVPDWAQKFNGVVRGAILADGNYDLRTHYDAAVESRPGRLITGIYRFTQGAGEWAVGVTAGAMSSMLSTNKIYHALLIAVDKTLFEGHIRLDDIDVDLIQRAQSNILEAHHGALKLAGFNDEDFNRLAKGLGIDPLKSAKNVRRELGEDSYTGAILGAWVEYANLAPAFAIMGALSAVAEGGAVAAEAVEAVGILMTAQGAGNTLMTSWQLQEAASHLEESWKAFSAVKGTPLETQARQSLAEARRAYFDAVQALAGEALGLVQDLAIAESTRRKSAMPTTNRPRNPAEIKIHAEKEMTSALALELEALDDFADVDANFLKTHAANIHLAMSQSKNNLNVARLRLLHALEDAQKIAGKTGVKEAAWDNIGRLIEDLRDASAVTAMNRRHAEHKLKVANKLALSRPPEPFLEKLETQLTLTRHGALISKLKGKLTPEQAKRFAADTVDGFLTGDKEDLRGFAPSGTAGLQWAERLRVHRDKMENRIIGLLAPRTGLVVDHAAPTSVELARLQALSGQARRLPWNQAGMFYGIDILGRNSKPAPGTVIEKLASTPVSSRHGQGASGTCASHAAACVGDSLGVPIDIEKVFLAGRGAPQDLIQGKGIYSDAKLREHARDLYLAAYDKSGPADGVSQFAMDEIARQVSTSRGKPWESFRLGLDEAIPYMRETGLPVYYTFRAASDATHAVVLKDPVVVNVKRPGAKAAEDLVRFTVIDSNRLGKESYIYMDEAARAQTGDPSLRALREVPKKPLPKGHDAKTVPPTPNERPSLWSDGIKKFTDFFSGPAAKEPAVLAREADSIRALQTESRGLFGKGSALRDELTESLREWIPTLNGKDDLTIQTQWLEAMKDTPIRFAQPHETDLMKKLENGAAMHREITKNGITRHEIVINPGMANVPPSILMASVIHEMTHRLGGGEIAAHRAEAAYIARVPQTGPPGANKAESTYRDHLAQLKQDDRDSGLDAGVVRRYPKNDMDLPVDELNYLIFTQDRAKARLEILKGMQSLRVLKKEVTPEWIKSELKRHRPTLKVLDCEVDDLRVMADWDWGDFDSKIESQISVIESFDNAIDAFSALHIEPYQKP